MEPLDLAISTLKKIADMPSHDDWPTPGQIAPWRDKAWLAVSDAQAALDRLDSFKEE